MGSRLSALSAARAIIDATTLGDRVAIPVDIALGKFAAAGFSASAMRIMVCLFWFSQRHLRSGERVKIGVALSHLRDAAGFGYSRDLDVIKEGLGLLERVTISLAVMNEESSHDRPSEYRRVALFDDLQIIDGHCRFIFSEDIIASFSDPESRYAMLSISDLSYLPKGIDVALFMRVSLVRKMRDPRFRVIDGDFGVPNLLSDPVSRARLRRSADRVGLAVGCAIESVLEAPDPVSGIRRMKIGLREVSAFSEMIMRTND